MTGSVACFACGHPYFYNIVIALGDGRAVPAKMCPCGWVYRFAFTRAEMSEMPRPDQIEITLEELQVDIGT